MPRDPGPSRNLKHSVHFLLDDEGFKHLNACAALLNIRTSEVARRGVELFYITICLNKSIDRTMQLTEQEATQ